MTTTYSCKDVGVIFEVSRMGVVSAGLAIISLAVKNGMEEPNLDGLDWDDPDTEKMVGDAVQDAEEWLNSNLADGNHHFGFTVTKDWGYVPNLNHRCKNPVE